MHVNFAAICIPAAGEEKVGGIYYAVIRDVKREI